MCVGTRYHPVFPWFGTLPILPPAQSTPACAWSWDVTHRLHAMAEACQAPRLGGGFGVAYGCAGAAYWITPGTATHEDHDAYAGCPTPPRHCPQCDSTRHMGTGESMP